LHPAKVQKLHLEVRELPSLTTPGEDQLPEYST